MRPAKPQPPRRRPSGDDDVAPDFHGRDLEREFADFATIGRQLWFVLLIKRKLRGLYPSSFLSAVRQRLAPFLGRASTVPAYLLMLVVNLCVFALQRTLFPTLLPAGARVNRLILHHAQLHRLATPMFLHDDAWQLIFDSVALWYLGAAVEGIYGAKRFLLIYLLSGVSGNLAGLKWGAPGPSVGESCSIFGLAGATLVYAYRARLKGQVLGERLSGALIQTIVAGIFARVRINRWAHLGGLIGGVVVAAICSPWGWGRERGFVSGRGYVIKSSGRKPLVPVWALNGSLAVVVLCVLVACYFGVDHALMLKQARGWRGVAEALFRSIVEQPPRRRGLWRYF